jgi:FdhD protein
MVEVLVRKVVDGQAALEPDVLAVEEPLEIRLCFGRAGRRREQSISITMRTPGHDAALAVGFLFSEGVIRAADQVVRIEHEGSEDCSRQQRNIVTVHLAEGVTFAPERLERHFYTTSSCGVCGKTSIEALEMAAAPSLPEGGPVVDAAVLQRLPAVLLEAQRVFSRTGGLHAAALFEPSGALMGLYEDVGRHNALDKLIGAQLMQRGLPLPEALVLVSGRASFELVQKALMAGVPILAAVGAPSSLAVALAERFGMTLAGFVRDGRCNVYAGRERVTETADFAVIE